MKRYRYSIDINSTRLATVSNLGVQFFSLFSQLVFIPIYLSHWGADIYGVWILLSGILGYAAILDLGISSAISLKIAEALNKSESKDLLSWQAFGITANIFVTVILFLGSIAIFGFFVGQPAWLSYFEINYLLLLFLLVLALSATVWGNYFLALVRISGGNAVASITAAVFIFSEALIPVAFMLTGSGITECLMAYLLIRTMYAIFSGWLYLKYFSIIGGIKILSTNEFSRRFRLIYKAAIANLSIPGSVSFYLQGLLFLCASHLGDKWILVYSTARTVSRVPFQFSYAFVRSNIPAITHAIASDNSLELASILSKVRFRVNFILVVGAIGFAILGPYVLSRWTKNSVNLNNLECLLIGVSTAFHGFWHLNLAVLSAANKHVKFGMVLVFIVLLLLTVLSIFLINFYFLLVAIFVAEFLIFSFSYLFLRKLYPASILSTNFKFK